MSPSTRIALRMTVFSIMLVLSSSVLNAEEYVIGTNDVLEIKFWQKADLNSTVRVGEDGKITLDIIGQIEAAGRTTDQLQLDIARQVSRLHKDISQAVVRVVEYNYQHVFVSGNVVTPGKMAFEKIPDLWTIIKESGGITEIGDLSRVIIVRGGDQGDSVITVDVARALADGKPESLPDIFRKDAIEVPRIPVGLLAPDLGQNRNKRNVVYVTGEVNTPGPIEYQEHVDILEAMAMANGPTELADLDKIRLVTRDGGYAQTYHIDLNNYMETGTLSRYTLRSEDVIYVPPKEEGWLNLTNVSAVLGVVTSAIIVWNYLDRDSESSSIR